MEWRELEGAKHNVFGLLRLHCSHRSITETCSAKVELLSACSMCGGVAGLFENFKCSILGHGWKFCGGAVM